MSSTVGFYELELKRYSHALQSQKPSVRIEATDFVNSDPTKISWTRALVNDLARLKNHHYMADCLVHAIYRPYTKQWMYFNRQFNEMVYQMPRIFPHAQAKNLVILIKGNLADVGQIALMVNTVVDLQPDRGAQCFPLHLYEKVEAPKLSESADGNLFEELSPEASNMDVQELQNGYVVRDGITDGGLQHFKDAYQGQQISKEDLFYYIYGLLHSEDYKKRYADNLSKELPRIPAVKKFVDFQAFSTAGRKLADLHIGYESVKPYPVEIEGGALLMSSFGDADYQVTQMKFPSKTDKTRVIYNHKITMSGIPLEAYDYVVNGKPALEWVMERQAVTTHKESGIVNDANLWATETVGNAAYPFKLFQRVITVSLETMKIVQALPRLDIVVGSKP